MSRSLHLDATRRSLVTPMLFSALDRGLQAHLVRISQLREFADGQIIQQRGDAADGFWLIDEGAVRVGQFMPDGEFRAVALLGPGDSYGELAVFADKPRIVDAVSRGESRLRLIGARPFLDALGNYPASSRALLGALSQQLQDTLSILAGLRRFREIVVHPVLRRLRHYLGTARRRQQDYRYFLQSGERPQSFQHLQPVHFRHVQIQEYEVRWQRLSRRQRRGVPWRR